MTMCRIRPGFALAVLAGLATAAACGGPGGPARAGEPASGPATAADARPLYQRLGGRPAVEAVVAAFVGRLAADPRVKFRFVNSDVAALTRDLVDFVCVAAGGACTYRGREMGVLHASMQVSQAEWDATVEALVASLEQFAVPPRERGELLGAIGPLEAQIVAPPAPPAAEVVAAIDAAAADPARFGDQAELMAAALAAARLGQRGHADQLFSMAEVALGAPAVAALVPLFRTGAPPRVTTAPIARPPGGAPQPRGAVGASDEDDAAAAVAAPARASLTGTLAIDLGAAGGEAFAVVTLTPLDRRPRRRVAKRREIEQRGREFAPRLLAVPVGSTVGFPNVDPIFHNVFSRSDARAFDLGIYKNGEARELRFDREGIVRIGCNLHANMAASIIVVSAPHYAVTDAAGGFRFRRLEPGRYELAAWTEGSAEAVRQVVTIAPGANTLAVAARAGDRLVRQDKFGAPRGTGR